jgi:hypothetical protein
MREEEARDEATKGAECQGMEDGGPADIVRTLLLFFF